MRQRIVSGARLAILLAAGVLALAVITLFLERLFAASQGQSWSLAIQATATLALVVITGWYAYVTFRLLRIQERPLTTIRLAAQEAAVRKLGELLANEPRDIGWALKGFPLNTTGKALPKLEYLEAGAEAIAAYSDELLATALGLPAAMSSFAATVIDRLLTSGTSMRRLVLAAIRERTAAAKAGNREPTWEGVRSEYRTIVQKEPNAPEWDVLLKGTQLIDAHKALKELHGQVADYLQGKG